MSQLGRPGTRFQLSSDDRKTFELPRPRKVALSACWRAVKALGELRRMAPARSVFVSYRRDDSADATGRILDRLRVRFGADALFRDVDDIPKGADFRAAVDGALDDARILLAVVGPRWAGKPENRLDDPEDVVRFELETACAREFVPIPTSSATSRI